MATRGLTIVEFTSDPHSGDVQNIRPDENSHVKSYATA